MSVHAKHFTNNHLKFQFFTEPELLDLTPTSGSANGGSYLVTSVDFKWDENQGFDLWDVLENHSNVKVRFDDGKGEVRTVDGSLISYPFHSSENPNAVACVTPEWPGKAVTTMTISFNGRDFIGSYKFTFTAKLQEFSIDPQCGPLEGNTKVTLTGAGLKDKAGMHLKWGNECRPVEAGDAEDTV